MNSNKISMISNNVNGIQSTKRRLKMIQCFRNKLLPQGILFLQKTHFPGKPIFRGMSPNILGNVAKHSGECPQIFRGMSPNTLGNVLKYSGECRQTFQGMSQNIPGNVTKLLSLISECVTVRYVLISSNQSEYLYSCPVCKNVLLTNPKETF